MALDGLGLDPTARAAFVLIMDNAKDRGWRCRLSNATMGRVLGRCPMTISRALGRLEAAGLVRRELAAGGRIRLAILVTWEGVAALADPRLTVQAELRRERLGGSALAREGLGASAEQTIPPIQGELSGAARSSLGGDEDASSRVASGPEAAAYLRMCVEAGRRGQPMPPPPASSGPSRTPRDATTPRLAATAAPAVAGPVSARPAAPASQAYATAPMVPPEEVSAVVTRMTRGLAEGLKAADLGRRRVGPKTLARQLSELRRRHGRRE